jgi:hypothetical protein
MSMLVKPWKLVGFAIGGTVGAATVRDYRRWRSLGEGGVPPNAIGYVVVSLLRLVKREPLSTKPYDAMKSDPYNQTWISGLPTRQGTRPSIDPHPIPQRQVDQHGASDVTAQTQKLFDRTVAAHSRLKYARSGFETRHDAVTLVAPDEGHAIAQRTRGEIAHIHPIDGSMHMVFSPRDAAQVLSAGWGERHALAGLARLPLTYLMVYAPRDDNEVAVMGRLLDASVSYMSQTQPLRQHGSTWQRTP